MVPRVIPLLLAKTKRFAYLVGGRGVYGMPLIRLDQFQQFDAINVLVDPGAIGGPKVIPSAVEVVLIWGLTRGGFGRNVLYGRYVGVYDLVSADATAALTALTSGATWTALAAHLAPTASLAGLTLRNVAVANQPIVHAGGGSAPGASSGTALPDEMAACITFRTAEAGPQGRGRMYVPGWATTALGTGGVIAAPAVAALEAWADTNIPAAFSALTATHCLGLPARAAYTGATGTQHPARAAKTLDVTSREVRDNHWDSQRRRGLR